jgi:hypothetical protein
MIPEERGEERRKEETDLSLCITSPDPYTLISGCSSQATIREG